MVFGASKIVDPSYWAMTYDMNISFIIKAELSKSKIITKIKNNHSAASTQL